MVKGSTVLLAIVDLNDGRWTATALEISRKLGLDDGRVVSPALLRLESASLVRRKTDGLTALRRYVPTERGRDLAGDLRRYQEPDRPDLAIWKPLVEFTDTWERMALR